MSESPKVVPPVTESPWFWVMLFSLAALAGIATIGPKFERREQAIETKFHARKRGLKREAAEQGAPVEQGQQPRWEPIFTVWPVMAVVGCVALVAFVQLIRLQRRRFRELRCDAEESPPGGARGLSGGNYLSMFDSPPITWFTENPTPILVTGGMVLMLLAVFFLKSGRLVLLWPAGAVLAFMGIAVLIDKLVVTEREQVQIVIYDAAAQAEKNHLEQVIDYISPSATGVRAEARRWIGQAKLESVTIAQLEVTVDKSKQPFTATAHFWVRAQGEAHTDTAIYRNYIGRMVVDFKKEGDRWLVTSYQRD